MVLISRSARERIRLGRLAVFIGSRRETNQSAPHPMIPLSLHALHHPHLFFPRRSSIYRHCHSPTKSLRMTAKLPQPILNEDRLYSEVGDDPWPFPLA